MLSVVIISLKEMTVKNWGLVIEFVFFIVLYGIDLGTDFNVLLEAQRFHTTYKHVLEKYNNTQANSNNTKQLLFCSSGPWIQDDIQREIKSFGEVLIGMKAFTALASFLILCYLVAYIWNIYRTMTDSNYAVYERNKNVTFQLVFGFACSMLQDIPLTCLAVALYIKRSGPNGLTCWKCYHDQTCADRHILSGHFEHTRTLVALSLLAVALVSLYNGFKTFFRWSETGVFRCFEIRACTSIFVGVCYVLVILTPALGLLKFEFFTLSSESSNFFSGITDRLFMIGAIIWIGFLFIIFCCPLLRCMYHFK